MPSDSQLLPIDLIVVFFFSSSASPLCRSEDERITLTYPSVTDGADETMLMTVVVVAAFDHDAKLMMDSKADYEYRWWLDSLEIK